MRKFKLRLLNLFAKLLNLKTETVYFAMTGENGFFVTTKPHTMERQPVPKGYMFFIDL